MRVTFDSNVWRIISSPDVFKNEPSIDDFKKIREDIQNNKIESFISETVFTIEAIQRKERKERLSSRKPKIDVSETTTPDGKVEISFSIGPGKGMNFNKNPILKKHFHDAIELGFNIARLPRIAGLTNDDIEPYRYVIEGEILNKYLDKVFEVERKINDKEAGIALIQSIGNKYDDNWIKGLKDAPDFEKRNIAKAAAEWADGDSIAICIALGCDYFCTRDQAKKAGDKSILSEDNLEWLKSDYGLKIITPEELSGKI